MKKSNCQLYVSAILCLDSNIVLLLNDILLSNKSTKYVPDSQTTSNVLLRPSKIIQYNVNRELLIIP